MLFFKLSCTFKLPNELCFHLLSTQGQKRAVQKLAKSPCLTYHIMVVLFFLFSFSILMIEIEYLREGRKVSFVKSLPYKFVISISHL